ncbi:MAG: integrase core domain-containing protein [Candidatus Methylomirabilales bacterium]
MGGPPPLLGLSPGLCGPGGTVAYFTHRTAILLLLSIYCSFPGSNGEGFLPFPKLQEAQVLIERWRQHYNGIRRHSALGYRPPGPRGAILAQACIASAIGVRVDRRSELTSGWTSQWGQAKGMVRKRYRTPLWSSVRDSPEGGYDFFVLQPSG